MASSRETAPLSSSISSSSDLARRSAPSTAKDDHSRQERGRGRGQGDGQQQQQQQQQRKQGGVDTTQLLREVVGKSDLLKSCIAVREDLGTAKINILRKREDEVRKAAAAAAAVTSASAVMELCDGTWAEGGSSGGDGGGDDGDWRRFGMVARRGMAGEGAEVAAAVEAALPLSRTFADKMSELAAVAPELSDMLVELTAVTTAASIPSAGGGSVSRSGPMSRSTPEPLSGSEADSFDYVQELIKVAPPALARLLSFEHIRASEPTARNLVQALVNLFIGVGSGLGSAASQANGAGAAASSTAASPATGSCSSSQKTPNSSSAASSGTSSRTPSPSAAGSSSSAGASTTGMCRSQPSVADSHRREKIGKKAKSWVVSILKQAISPKVYGGKLVRSKGLDALLGRRGVGAIQHNRAVQDELLKSGEVLRGLIASDLALMRRRLSEGGGVGSNPRPAESTTASSARASPLSYLCNPYRGSRKSDDDFLSSNPDHQYQHQQGRQYQLSGRKRSRPAPQESRVPARPTWTPGAASGAHSKFSGCFRAGMNPDTWQQEQQEQQQHPSGWPEESAASVPANVGASRLFRGASWREAEKWGGAARAKRPAEVLLENTIEAFCCMLGAGGGGHSLPTQLFRASLEQDAYRFLSPAAPLDSDAAARGSLPTTLLPEGTAAAVAAAATEDESRPLQHPQQTRPSPSSSTHSLSTSLAGSVPGSHAYRPRIGIASKPAPPPLHPRFRSGSLLPLLLDRRSPPLPVPPAEWGARVLGCLSALSRRPLLCPDTLLRDIGATPSLPPVACMRGTVAGGGGCGGSGVKANGKGSGGSRSREVSNKSCSNDADSGGGSNGGAGRSAGSLFPLSEACFLVSLDLVQEAVLEEGCGGEAAAGLLRAFRTVRNSVPESRGIAGGNACGAESGARGNVSEGEGALTGGSTGRQAEGREVSPLVELLEQRPSGCAKASLDALVWALDDTSKQYGREDDDSAIAIMEVQEQRSSEAVLVDTNGAPPKDSPCPNTLERSFEAELWLLVLGYRHWVLVALVHLLSTAPCASCATGATGQAESEGRRRASAVRLLAWHACGGASRTEGERNELEEAEEAVRRMAKLLEGYCDRAKAGGMSTTSPAGGKYPSAAASTPRTGDSSPSPASLLGPETATVRVTAALKAAGREGQGVMGAVFAPFLAVAWLLSSPLALASCEGVLRCSVLRDQDLDGAFGAGADGVDAASRRRPSSRACLERVLQGLAALEDMVWVCGISPPMSHVHSEGQDLMALLKRTQAWLSGLCRRRRNAQGDGGGIGGGSGSGDETTWWTDFTSRIDALSRGLGALLAES